MDSLLSSSTYGPAASLIACARCGASRRQLTSAALNMMSTAEALSDMHGPSLLWQPFQVQHAMIPWYAVRIVHRIRRVVLGDVRSADSALFSTRKRSDRRRSVAVFPVALLAFWPAAIVPPRGRRPASWVDSKMTGTPVRARVAFSRLGVISYLSPASFLDIDPAHRFMVSTSCSALVGDPSARSCMAAILMLGDDTSFSPTLGQGKSIPKRARRHDSLRDECLMQKAWSRHQGRRQSSRELGLAPVRISIAACWRRSVRKGRDVCMHRLLAVLAVLAVPVGW